MSKKEWIKTFLMVILMVYLLASIMFSVWYNIDRENAWFIATCRNGLLVLGFDSVGVYLLSPFSNYADVFLLGINFEDWRIFSDGLKTFGERF